MLMIYWSSEGLVLNYCKKSVAPSFCNHQYRLRTLMGLFVAKAKDFLPLPNLPLRRSGCQCRAWHQLSITDCQEKMLHLFLVLIKRFVYITDCQEKMLHLFLVLIKRFVYILI